MKNLLKISIVALLAVFGAFAVATINPGVVYAQDEGEQAETQEEQHDHDEEDHEEKSSYTFTAQGGDSYTKIARKSVQIHGIENDVDLSQAQIIAAETFLTSEAGFPAVNEGEEVSISEDAVKAAVEKAKNLDEAAQSRWQKYVASVDFNTDNVGESRS